MSDISEIFGEYIKLSQWLKKEDYVSTGGEAKALIEEGKVTVNGEVAFEIRKKLRDGDVIAVNGSSPVTIRAKAE